MLSGDHVLPRITPNISFHPQAGPDPLGDFLGSLDKVGAYDVDEVLPAHEYRFVDLPARVSELKAHHQARFEEAISAIRAGVDTTWGIAERMTWNRPWDADAGLHAPGRGRRDAGPSVATSSGSGWSARRSASRRTGGWSTPPPGPERAAVAQPRRVTAREAASRTTAHDRARRVCSSGARRVRSSMGDHLTVAQRHAALDPSGPPAHQPGRGAEAALGDREGEGEQGGEDGADRQPPGLGHVGGQDRKGAPGGREAQRRCG